jgi:membrane associated rhomboid family serine protease
MAVPPYVEGEDRTGRGRLRVDAARLWTGGLATALVAALGAVVGVLVARGLFDVPVLAPQGDGALGNANTARLAILAAVAALLATGPMHLLLVSTPRPFRFFTWIMSLLTLVAVLAPFMTGAKLATKVATAAIGLVVGMAIGSLVSGAARSAIRLSRQDPRLPKR